MLDKIDFSKIPIFLTAAECLNFTEAANRHFMSQSSLSKAIAAFEASVGFPLFIRGNRKVSLTPEGEYLYRELSRVMKDVDNIITTAAKMRDGDIGSFCIGTSGYLFKTPLFEKICSEFSKARPSYEIELSHMPYFELRKSLVDDKVDAILFNQHDLAVLHGVYMLPIAIGSTVLLCAPDSRPRKDDRPLSVEDFKNSRFVCLDREAAPSYYKYMMSCCKAYGFTPNIARYSPSIIELLHYINNAGYVTILDRTIVPAAVSEDTMIPVAEREGMERLDTVLAWKAENTSPVLRSYVEFAQKLVSAKARLI